jgi:Ulp1 family protease
MCSIKDFDVRKLLNSKINTAGMVYNLDPSYLPGSHWVSMFIDCRKDKPIITYFDSAGKFPPYLIQE